MDLEQELFAKFQSSCLNSMSTHFQGAEAQKSTDMNRSSIFLSLVYIIKLSLRFLNSKW